jgi:hypothetical protein
VAGLRYTFVSGADARAEYVHQDAGYSSAQTDLAAVAVASQATWPRGARPRLGHER